MTIHANTTDPPHLLPKFQATIKRRTILELILAFEETESEEWKSWEIVDFLVSKLNEIK